MSSFKQSPGKPKSRGVWTLANNSRCTRCFRTNTWHEKTSKKIHVLNNMGKLHFLCHLSPLHQLQGNLPQVLSRFLFPSEDFNSRDRTWLVVLCRDQENEENVNLNSRKTMHSSALRIWLEVCHLDKHVWKWQSFKNSLCDSNTNHNWDRISQFSH